MMPRRDEPELLEERASRLLGPLVAPVAEAEQPLIAIPSRLPVVARRRRCIWTDACLVPERHKRLPFDAMAGSSTIGLMDHVSEVIARAAAERGGKDRLPAVSAVVKDGSILEMVYEPSRQITAYACFKDGTWDLIPDYELPEGRRLVPLSPRNNLIEHGVVRLPTGPEEYGSERELESSVRAFIHRYVNLTPRFERVATAYVLLSWIADTFNELPYLRVRGEPGTGKTRFLLTVGSICYKPIFASGASTVSPIFRILDLVKGTLVLDESDFRFSDEKAEVVKILNNGNVRGFPVLRTETVPGSKEFNPRAYHVFGPKLIATRGFFDDPALESRFLTEEMNSLRLREDIPISLPARHEVEALRLRNQLLLFRFRNYGKPRNLVTKLDRSLEPRLAQIFAPLLAIVEDEETLADLRELARTYHGEMVADRGLSIEADLLALLVDLWGSASEPPTVKEVAERLAERSPRAYVHVSAKRVGWLLRKRLGLETVRNRTGYVVVLPEQERLDRLTERYGTARAADSVRVGSSPSSPRSPEELPPSV